MQNSPSMLMVITILDAGGLGQATLADGLLGSAGGVEFANKETIYGNYKTDLRLERQNSFYSRAFDYQPNR